MIGSRNPIDIFSQNKGQSRARRLPQIARSSKHLNAPGIVILWCRVP
jgi:hypothetical protein